MNDSYAAVRTQVARQVAHWTAATLRLQNLDDLASPAAWNSLERYLGLALRQHLTRVVARLNREGLALKAALETASSLADLNVVRRMLLAFRALYLRVETTLNFFTDAINTRTNPMIGGLLRACDTLAHRSIAQLLDLLGMPTPVVLTYIETGIGASILKAGLRLWDGDGVNPVAAIKITWHNLGRATALIHEAGHQTAHITDWTPDLAAALRAGLARVSVGAADVWAGWASEIAADAFAFVHTGYASVAALHDVLDGGSRMVFRHLPGDPHPISYLRVLLGVAMCRQFYGPGPWDDLARAWTLHYPLERAPATTAHLIHDSLPLLPYVADITLCRPARALKGRPLAVWIDPERVRPATLLALEQQLGTALYTSLHWIWTEALRLLALTGLLKATMVDRAAELTQLQEQWMLRLGGALPVA